MKKTLLLAALFLVLGGATWYALTHKGSQTGTLNSWDMEFAVKNTGDIYKIFLADRKGQTTTLERKDGYWLYNGKARARPTAVSTLLETIARVNVRYVPTKEAEAAMIKSIAGEGVKVELYDKEGKKIKCYYVGGVTNDEQGTYMMMDGAEQPYVTHVPSFVGQLRGHYMMGDDNWTDRSIFHEKPEEIAAISIEYPQMRSESFRLEKVDEAGYVVKPYFSATPASKQPQRKGLPEAYLLQFERRVAEGFETQNRLRDSVTNLVPFAIVTVKKIDGQEKQVRFWPADTWETRDGQQYIHRYFAEVNKDAFMLIQEQVFGPIFRGYSFFFEGTPASRMRN